MGILSWIIVGGLAGWIASKVMDTDESMGAVANVITGIIGAFIGGLVMNMLGGTGITGFNLWSLIVSIIGAIIFLWILKMLSRKRT